MKERVDRRLFQHILLLDKRDEMTADEYWKKWGCRLMMRIAYARTRVSKSFDQSLISPFYVRVNFVLMFHVVDCA